MRILWTAFLVVVAAFLARWLLAAFGWPTTNLEFAVLALLCVLTYLAQRAFAEV